MPLRVIFFGTAELACTSLEALARNADFQVIGVVTQPDKPRGRDLQVQPSAVKAMALKLALPVLQPKRARSAEFIAEVRALTPDLGVVVAYGQILPQDLLDVPPHGFLNVHTSLLPKHRGAAPIQWALLSGDTETGVTIMKMDAGLDTGPILTQEQTSISGADTSQSLHDRLAVIGADLLIRTIPLYTQRHVQPCPQPAGASYARKIEKTDGRVNWNEPADLIDRKIRAFTPWPGAFTSVEIGKTARVLKIWKAKPVVTAAQPGELLPAAAGELLVGCGEGALQIIEVQPEGKKRMPIHDFLVGNKIARVLT